MAGCCGDYKIAADKVNNGPDFAVLAFFNAPLVSRPRPSTAALASVLSQMSGLGRHLRYFEYITFILPLSKENTLLLDICSGSMGNVRDM